MLAPLLCDSLSENGTTLSDEITGVFASMQHAPNPGEALREKLASDQRELDAMPGFYSDTAIVLLCAV